MSPLFIYASVLGLVPNPSPLLHPGEGAASILPQVAEPRKGARFDRRNGVSIQVEVPGQEAGEEGQTERAGGKGSRAMP